MSTISAIYGARKQAGLDDDTARDLYERETGKRSLREMKPGEQVRVLQALRRAGGSPRQQLSGPYAKKLQALWISGWNLGVVRDRRDDAMLSFVARQTGIEHTRFLRDAMDARKAVEALKSWLAREGGVDWKPIDRLDNRDEADRVIWAQLVKLCQPISLQTFDEDLLEVGVLGLDLAEAVISWRHGRLDAAGKVGVMQGLGEIIRKAVH